MLRLSSPFECVELAITKTLPHISRARAYDIALHAHTNGQSTILQTWEEKGREVAEALQGEGLTVSLLPEKVFTGGEDDAKEGEEERPNGRLRRAREAPLSTI
ncbi:hypothetical protein Efla_006237 [Eimeria flavescens]